MSTLLTGSLAIEPPGEGALVSGCGLGLVLDLVARNGTTPYFWSVVSGALPPGLALSSGGQISGAASAEGTFAFRVRAEDRDGARAERDLVFTVVDGLPYVAIAASGSTCKGASQTLSVPGAWSSYLWLPDGQISPTISVSPLHPQTIGVVVTEGSGCQRHGSITLSPRPGTAAPAVSALAVVTSGTSGLSASVAAHAGSTYAWTITGGTITAGQGTNAITFNAGAPGTLILTVVETIPGNCPSAPSGKTVDVRAPSATAGFYTVTPCRVLDTRGPVGPWGGPSLAANATRSFVVAGTCGMPADAKAVSANVTTVDPAAWGFLALAAGDFPAPPGAALPFGLGLVRANQAMLQLASDGSGTVRMWNQSSGNVDVVLDVNGYFR